MSPTLMRAEFAPILYLHKVRTQYGYLRQAMRVVVPQDLEEGKCSEHEKKQRA